jgi:hypothetical protein
MQTMETAQTMQTVHLQRLVRLFSSTESLPLKDLLGNEGNAKIPSTTAIFNMSSAHDCPSKKLGLCKASQQGAKCYAIKAEYSYHPEVLPYRRAQGKFWGKVSATDFAKQFLLINTTKRFPFKSLRLNESGDFRSQECVDKAEVIARLLRLQGIKTYCYSSRSYLDFSKCKDLIVSGSNFKKDGVSNIFKIIGKKEDKPKGWAACRMNCRICNLCQIRGQKIVVKKH